MKPTDKSNTDMNSPSNTIYQPASIPMPLFPPGSPYHTNMIRSVESGNNPSPMNPADESNTDMNCPSNTSYQPASIPMPLFPPGSPYHTNMIRSVDSGNNPSPMNQRPPLRFYVPSAPPTSNREAAAYGGMGIGLQGAVPITGWCLGRQQQQAPAGHGYQGTGGYQGASGYQTLGHEYQGTGGYKGASGYQTLGHEYQGTGGYKGASGYQTIGHEHQGTGGYKGASGYQTPGRYRGSRGYQRAGAGGYQGVFPGRFPPPLMDYSELPSWKSRHVGQGDGHLQSLPPKPYESNAKQSASGPTTLTFTMNSDDFPALPGPTPSSSGSRAFRASNRTAAQDSSSKPGINNNQTEPEDKSPQIMGIVTSSDGKVTNIPANMVNDQFGMAGLLSFLRAKDSNPNLASLAMGIELTDLGMKQEENYNSYPTFGGPLGQGPVIPTFGGPLGQGSVIPEDMDCPVPEEYSFTHQLHQGHELVSSVREKLKPLKMTAYNEELLFYLFYTYTQDVLQVLAAAELYNRDWRYHKEEQVWITRATGWDTVEKGLHSERGIFHFFDPSSFQKIRKEFTLEYDQLEGRPMVPNQYRLM